MSSVNGQRSPAAGQFDHEEVEVAIHPTSPARVMATGQVLEGIKVGDKIYHKVHQFEGRAVQLHGTRAKFAWSTRSGSMRRRPSPCSRPCSADGEGGAGGDGAAPAEKGARAAGAQQSSAAAEQAEEHLTGHEKAARRLSGLPTALKPTGAATMVDSPVPPMAELSPAAGAGSGGKQKAKAAPEAAPVPKKAKAVPEAAQAAKKAKGAGASSAEGKSGDGLQGAAEGKSGGGLQSAGLKSDPKQAGLLGFFRRAPAAAN